jgi:hypothetical protein
MSKTNTPKPNVNFTRIMLPLLTALAAHDSVVEQAASAAEPTFKNLELTANAAKAVIDAKQAEIDALNEGRNEKYQQLKGLGTSKAEATVAKTLQSELDKLDTERAKLIEQIQQLRADFRPHRENMNFISAIRKGVLPTGPDGKAVKYRGENQVVRAAGDAIYQARATLYTALTGRNGALMPTIEVLGKPRLSGVAELMRQPDGSYAVPTGKAGDDLLAFWSRISDLGVNVRSSNNPERVQVGSILGAAISTRAAKAKIEAAASAASTQAS